MLSLRHNAQAESHRICSAKQRQIEVWYYKKVVIQVHGVDASIIHSILQWCEFAFDPTTMKTYPFSPALVVNIQQLF